METTLTPTQWVALICLTVIGLLFGAGFMRDLLTESGREHLKQHARQIGATFGIFLVMAGFFGPLSLGLVGGFLLGMILGGIARIVQRPLW